jgi:formiminotetrahydrofolate cyclodeaminase
MPTHVWDSTLDNFRGAAASGEPMPAGVSVSAVSASLAFGLLSKVLKVSGRKKEFSGNLPKLEALLESVRGESKRMMQFADEDIAAFNAYVATTRLPHLTDAEREARKRAVDAAVQKAIEVPLAAARAAASGIGLCGEAASMAHPNVAADLGAATSLLASAMRVFLLCADSNIRQVASDPSAYRKAVTDRFEWENKASRQAESVFKQVTATINAAGAKQGRKV